MPILPIFSKHEQLSGALQTFVSLRRRKGVAGNSGSMLAACVAVSAFQRRRALQGGMGLEWPTGKVRVQVTTHLTARKRR
jgi:hypothetical protein